MKTAILTICVILTCSVNLFAAPPSRYSSTPVRNSSGRTVGREVNKSFGGVKSQEFYNMSGKKVQSTRHSTNPYSRSPLSGGYNYNGNSRGYNNSGPHTAGKK